MERPNKAIETIAPFTYDSDIVTVLEYVKYLESIAHPCAVAKDCTWLDDVCLDCIEFKKR